ncbi:MAG: PAS domain S-box protein [Leptospiraceae bacterium]|nr:PAS domain S-box protein [Leptospiraceae bacterium]
MEEELLEIIPVGFVRVALDGQILYANPMACQILSLEKDELTGAFYQNKSFGQIGLDGQAMDPAELPLAVALQQQKTARDVVHGITDPVSHEVRWLSVSASPQTENGQLVGAAATFTDITDRIKKDQIYRQIIENSTDMICLHRANGIYEYVNPAVERILGYHPSDLVGTDPYAIFHPADARRIRELSHTPVETGELERGIRYRIRKKDGTYTWLQTTSHPIVDPSGQVTGIQTISRDVSLDVEREQGVMQARLLAEKANQAKSEFIAGMSHDVRTPIHGVLGLAELLMEKEADPERAQMLAMMQSSAKSLLNVIDDLLDLNRLEAGQIQLKYSWLTVHELAQALRSLYMQAASAKGLRFSITESGHCEGFLLGDLARIQQIVGNIVSNAIHFTESGSVHVAIVCSELDGLHRSIRIDVEDTGPGMETGEQKRIFDQFEHVNLQDSGHHGLGLTVAQLLLKEMGGELRLQSEPGKGSRFSVHLELEYSDSVQSDAGDARGQMDRACQIPLRILIAEDAPENRELMRRFLAHTAWKIDFAEDGMKALEMGRTARYDAILLDISMPELNGFQVARELIQGNAAAGRPNPPLIALTAFATEEDHRKSIQAGFDLHITKPFSRNKLLHALTTLLFRRGHLKI